MDCQDEVLSCQGCKYWKEQCQKESIRLAIITQRADREAQRATTLESKLFDARDGLVEVCQKLQDVGPSEPGLFAQEGLLSNDLATPTTDKGLASENAGTFQKPVVLLPTVPMLFKKVERRVKTPAAVESQSVPETIPFEEARQVSGSKEISGAETSVPTDIDNTLICSSLQPGSDPVVTDARTGGKPQCVQGPILRDTSAEQMNRVANAPMTETLKAALSPWHGPECAISRSIEEETPIKSFPVNFASPIASLENRGPAPDTIFPRPAAPRSTYTEPQSSIDPMSKGWSIQTLREMENIGDSRKRVAPWGDDRLDTASVGHEPPTKRLQIGKGVLPACAVPPMDSNTQAWMSLKSAIANTAEQNAQDRTEGQQEGQGKAKEMTSFGDAKAIIAEQKAREKRDAPAMYGSSMKSDDTASDSIAGLPAKSETPASQLMRAVSNARLRH
ncbi:MAG: hypothetical protein Q9160_004769 [Pyrenula sp. 1 TL-2023]